MKKVIIIASLFAAFSVQASNNDNDKGGNASVGNVSGGAGGHGGAGGNASAGAAALAGAIATGGNSNATGGAVIGSGNSSNSNKIDNKNTNTNAQGQQQGQAQGQQQSSNSVSGVKNSGNSASKSSSNSGGNTQSNAGNNTSVSVEGDIYQAARIPVSTAYAPSIAPTAPCMGSTSGGAQGAGFGFSIGGTWTDDNCVLLEQVRATSNLGEKEVAQEMMQGIPAYAAAKKRLSDRKSGKASVSSATYSDSPSVTSSVYTGNDPIVMKRLGLPPLK